MLADGNFVGPPLRGVNCVGPAGCVDNGPSVAPRLMKRLAASRRGSTMAMMAAGLIPVVAGLGSAIDTGRMYVVKSQLQAGVDAAALAGARAFQITAGNNTNTCTTGTESNATSRCAQVKSYFYGNFPSTYMGVSNLQLVPTFSTNNQNINTTTVTATATLPMSFMRAFGFQNATLTATAKAELQPRPLEVMVVLDNTGSMRTTLSAGQTRIQALKTAATDFVDILHQGATQRRDLAIGFLPYDITVNVGGLLPAGAVAQRDGFNGLLDGSWPTNRLGWKGCVMNDSTVRDVSNDRTVSEANAWDVTRNIPGTNGEPAVEPYFVPPLYIPSLALASATTAERANPAGNFYALAGSGVEGRNNLYRIDANGMIDATRLANSAIYRGYFYDYYKGLNGNATDSDDVIRPLTGTGVYDVSTDKRAATDWYVDWTRIPHFYESAYFTSPSDGRINPLGGNTDNINQNTTLMPTPNWQCPEAAMPVAYNRLKSDYINHITNENAAIYPGNGTIHHAGMLWGYRLLVRDDVFTRTNPTNEAPRRALVFMTDGLNEVNESPSGGYFDRVFTWYGKWAESSTAATSIAGVQSQNEEQMVRRFEKTCANLQRETNPPKVYIIALVANSTRINTAFDQCAPGRVYRTSSTTELRQAFQDVASELVDLHLIQ